MRMQLVVAELDSWSSCIITFGDLVVYHGIVLGKQNFECRLCFLISYLWFLFLLLVFMHCLQWGCSNLNSVANCGSWLRRGVLKRGVILTLYIGDPCTQPLYNSWCCCVFLLWIIFVVVLVIGLPLVHLGIALSGWTLFLMLTCICLYLSNPQLKLCFLNTSGKRYPSWVVQCAACR